MAQAHSESAASADRARAAESARLRHIAVHRRVLAFEGTAALAAMFGLIEAVHYIDAATRDLQFAFGMALFVFAVALILLFRHANEVLDLECPHCAEPFHGDGVEELSTPFRLRCAHCASSAAPRNS
jgi:hypothetical protein